MKSIWSNSFPNVRGFPLLYHHQHLGWGFWRSCLAGSAPLGRPYLCDGLGLFFAPKEKVLFLWMLFVFWCFLFVFFVWCVFFGVIGFFFNQLTWNAMRRHVPCQLNMSQPTDLTLFVALLIVCYMRWPIIMLKFLWVKPKLHHQSMKFPGFTRCYFKETCNHFWKPASSLRHTWWDLP